MTKLFFRIVAENMEGFSETVLLVSGMFFIQPPHVTDKS